MKAAATTSCSARGGRNSEAALQHTLRARITVQASFDEFNLDIRLLYQGETPEFPDRRPSKEQFRDNGVRLLAHFMLSRNADRVRPDAKNGRAQVHFHFDH